MNEAAAAPRRPVPDGWGIDDGYEDARGQWRDTAPATRTALVEAMGGQPGQTGPDRVGAPLVWWRGGVAPASGPGDLVLEDGTSITVDGALPGDLPLGYHALHRRGEAVQLIVAPASCHVPADSVWGWAVQLYGLRSATSWGIGDFRDLRDLGGWAAGHGAGFIVLNPLGASTPVTPQQPSPYFPSSRRFKSLLYLSIDEVPGAEMLGPELTALAESARRLNAERRIDRDAVFQAKRGALERIWARAPDTTAACAYRKHAGQALDEFATFCALAEQFGAGWRAWPAEFRNPGSPAVRRFSADRADRVAFHSWIQWCLDEQYARATHVLPGVQDLPIGVDPEGADAWAWQDVLANGVEVGAPPDLYNVDGQAWGLPPFVPYRLARAGYEPFIQTIRASLRHAGGLRIDHVMGLFRLFWIPRGAPPANGAFVRYQADALLAIVALESARAEAFIVGEDLGTVERDAREQLDARGILSYRLLWFEALHPRDYPVRALAAVTTHDLPTIRGLWTRDDVRAQRALGLRPYEAGYDETRRRVTVMAGLPEEAPVDAVIEALHELLARSASLRRVATLEDALAVAERPNMPGAPPPWPNWSLALPQSLEALKQDRLATRIAARLNNGAAREVIADDSPRSSG